MDSYTKSFLVTLLIVIIGVVGTIYISPMFPFWAFISVIAFVLLWHVIHLFLFE